MPDPIMLVINPSESWCGACGKGANPRAKSHDVVMSYGGMAGQPGCGVAWTHVTSDYQSIDGLLYERVQAMRPDLEAAFGTFVNRAEILRGEGT